MSTVKTDSVIGSFLPIPVIEHATDFEVYTATVGQTVFTTTKFDRSNAIRAIAKSSGGAFSEVTASWTAANTVTISGAILGAGQIFYIFKVGTHASKIRVQDPSGAWVDLSSYAAAKAGANSDITSLTGLTTPLSVAQGGTGKTTEFRKGAIDGLRLIYTSRTTFTVSAGSAYVSSLGKIVELTADKVVTPTLAASTMYHAYMFENAGVADVELVTTVPVKYFGCAYQKTGDASRRYIGSMLTNASSQFLGFQHDLIRSRVIYTEGDLGVAPFVLWSNFSATTYNIISQVPLMVPKETALDLIAYVNCGNGLAIFGIPDQLTGPAPAGSGFVLSVGSQSGNTYTPADIPLSRAPATLGAAYVKMSGGSSYAFGRGYYFER